MPILVGGLIAHAFGPGTYTISGDIHLDDDEDWTLSVNPKDGVNLLAVTIHEIGTIPAYFDFHEKKSDLSDCQVQNQI